MQVKSNFNSHRRHLVLKEFYECEYDITSIKIGSARKSNKKPKTSLTPKGRLNSKRRPTPMNTDAISKRWKIAEEDPDDMELDDKIV